MDLNNVEFTWIKNKPESWKTQRVKNHFILTKNRTETPQGYPILSLTMKGIIERDISSNEGQLPETYNGYNLLEKDDIVFNPMDLISGWVDCSPYEGLISPSYKVLRPISKKVNIKFYTYYFQTHYKEKIFFPFGEGVHYEYRWGLGTETLKNFPIIVPPLTEQQQIVSFLDTKTSLIDSLIEKTKRKIELLKEKRTSLINEVVTKGLNPNVEMKDSGVEWIGEIPSHWEYIPTKYFTINDKGVQTGPFGTQLNTKDYVESGVKVMNQKTLIDEDYDIGEEFISYEKYESLKVFEVIEGDIIMGTRGSFGTGKRTTFGKVSIVPSGLGDCVLHPCLIRIRLKENLMMKRYYYIYVNDSSYFLDDVKDTSNSTTIEVIYGVTLKDIKVPVPPIQEQQQIVEYLDEQTGLIDKTISIEEKRIKLLKEYRQSLISEVVTGKRKVV